MKRGNCYVTCEALYHLLGGKKAGFKPCVMKYKGETHWYLEYNTGFCTTIIDPTASQFKEKLDYNGRGCGFLTKKPSKRARQLMKKLVWQEN